MVNTRYNGVRPTTFINELDEEPTTRGCGRGKVRSRVRDGGQGRVAPARSGASVENAPRKEAPSAPQEEVHKNVEI